MIELRSLAGLAPADCALVHDGVAFTGSALNRDAETVANALSRGGVGSGHRVAVLQGNTPRFAACVLALMKIGASSVLLSTRSTSREIADAVGRTGASMVLGNPDASARLSLVPGLAAAEAIEVSVGVGPIDVWHTPHRAAVARAGEVTVQFTSGVSGRAKIVARTTANLEDELESFASHLGLAAADATVCPSPLSQTYGFVNGFLLPFFSGRTAILMDWFLPNGAAELVRRYRARVLVGVPTMYKAMVEAYGPVAADVSSLRLCFSAGAPLTPAVARDFETRYGLDINQQYGTTETGVIAVNLLDGLRDVLAIGRPVPGREIDILDDHGSPVAPGECGHVVVRSAATAIEYLGDRDLSAEKFRDGRYLTGDVGSFNDGLLRVTGRRTAFINVAGLKVDPQEVERVLATCDAVAECAVVPMKDESCGEVVRAVIVIRTDTTVTKLQQFCRTRLAAHKVPRQVTFVDALPRSPTGKVLLKDLIDSA